MPIKHCRVCKSDFFKKPLLRYQNMPKAAQFLPDKEKVLKEKGVNLEVYQCSGCGLIQLNSDPVPYYKEVIRAAQRSAIDVSLCGEMAGEPEFAMLLLGLGLRTFSITPPAIPEIKKIIRSVTIDQCRRVARKAGSFDSDREIVNYLKDEVSKVMPEVFDGRSIGF